MYVKCYILIIVCNGLVILVNNQNTINDIRNKINIVDLIGEYVPLTKKGQYYWGKCPFHNDNNPSMSVDPNRQIYRCWSCHNSGNVFNFYEQIENITFAEALKRLGDRVGISIGTVKVENNKYSKYYEIYDLTSKFYSLMLNSSSGKDAKKYLQERGINEEAIKEFGIGLSLDENDRLIKYLKEKKVDINTLNDLGLANNDNDTFINRIIFPLDDRQGRIVGFSGRIYHNEDFAKYMNTKETPIFRKGNCLYHYNASKEEVRLKKYAIVMEGFMDVIRASTIGIKNTVALMGTALTEEQISLLKKLSNTIYLCLDGDTPGLTANLHNGELLEKAGLEVKVIYLKDDEDPDTYILKNGKEKFEELIENALNYSDYRIERLRNNVDFSSDADVAKYVNEVLKETALIKDDIRQEIILKKLAIETYLSYNTLDKKLSELKGNKKEEKVEEVRKEKKLDKYTRASLEFIYYMLNNEEVIRIFDSKKLYFINSSLRALAGEISYYYHNYGEINIADFYTYLNDKKELIPAYEEVVNLNLDNNVDEETLNEYVKVISDYNVQEEIKRLEKEMRSKATDSEKIEIAERIRLLRIGEN